MHLPNRRRFSPCARLFAVLVFLAGSVGVSPGRAAADEERQGADEVREGANRYRYWTTNWSFEDFDVATLTQRLARIGVELPVALSGDATVDFEVSVPLNALRDPQAYRFRGTFASERLDVDGVPLEELNANLEYDDGTLRLVQFRGRLREGRFRGSGSADLVPRDRFEAAVELERLDLAPIAELLAAFGVGSGERPARGQVAAELQVSGPLETLTDVLTWRAEGNATVDGFAVGDSSTFTVNLDTFRWQDRQLSAPGFRVTSADHPDFRMTATADVGLPDAERGTGRRLDVKIEADDLPAEQIAELWTDSAARWVVGKVDLKGTATGDDAMWRVDADIASPDLRVGGVQLGLVQHRARLTPGEFEVEPLTPIGATSAAQIRRLRAAYQIGEQVAELTSLDAELFGGTVRGDASIALQPEGRHTVALRWEGVRPSIRLPVAIASPPPVAGTLTGDVDWSVPAAELDLPASHRGTATFRVADLRLGRETLGEIDLGLAIDGNRFRIDGEGNLFGGEVRLRSDTPLEAEASWEDWLGSISNGNLEFRSVSLRQLSAAVPRSGVPASSGRLAITGRLDGTTRVAVDESGVFEADSSWSLRDATADGMPLSRRLDLDWAVRGSELSVRRMQGELVGGRVDASGRWPLDGAARVIDVRFAGLDARRAVMPLGLATEVSGRASGRATVTATGDGVLPTAFRVAGTIRIADGQLAGVPVGNVHGPIRLNFEREPIAWRLAAPQVRSAVAGGIVDGNVTIASAPGGRAGMRLESRWRLSHVDFEDLVSAAGGTTTVGRGDVSGELRLGGRNVRDLRDLTGEFRARLGGTDATAVPVLASTGPILGAASLAGNRFTAGDLRGNIRGGAVQIRELTLRGDRMRVIAEGRVGMTDGRMDVQAVIALGNFEAQNIAIALLIERAIVPLSVISTVNRIVSDRTVVLNVTGTAGDPQIRVMAAPTVRANTRRILLRETIGLTLPEAIALPEN